MLLAEVAGKDTMLATPGGATKRKPEQEQDLPSQVKQQRSNSSCNNKQQFHPRRQPKMYYNSNARPFWMKLKATEAKATTTLDTTTATSAAAATATATSAATATAATYDKMQRCNQNGGSTTSTPGNKRCSQKYAGNLAAAGMMAYQQHATATLQAGSNTGAAKHPTRKSRYNNNKQQGQQHQQQQQQQQQRPEQYGNLNMRKRNSGATGSESSPSPPAAAWLEQRYGHRLVKSSFIEDKFLGQHNPGHRNSTSSEATSEDIDSSTPMLQAAAPASAGSKARPKRQQKQQKLPPQQQQQQQNPDQQQNPGKMPSHSKPKQGNPAGKWRHQNPTAPPTHNGNNSNNPQQQLGGSKRGANGKKPGKPNHNNGHGNGIGGCGSGSLAKHNGGSNNRNGILRNGITCSDGNSSSSALSSPTSSPTVSPQNRKRMPGLEWRKNSNFLVPPLRQYEQLDLDDRTLVQQLRRHIIDHHLLRVYGFPVESVVHEGAIEIFKCLPHMSFAAALAETAPAVTVINCHDGLAEIGGEEGGSATSSDSGNSSPRSLDSESGGEWSGSECESSSSSSGASGSSSSSSSSSTKSSSSSACSSGSDAGDLNLELKYCQYVQVERSLAKPCARCKRHFLVDELTGEYLTCEECHYHSGKFQRYFDGVSMGRWSCCHATDESSPGCCHSERHVWTGSVVGVNGPYHDFVRTQPRRRMGQDHDLPAVYALDCEMSYTGRGLDVTKVSLVALNGQLVYEHFVRPECDIIDYNTRYSGITERDLRTGGGAKSLADVQRDLLELISADTILIGHGLDNDLRALRIVHNTLIDTSISFPHCSGFPYRRALRHLTKVHLKREIQSGDGTTGHSSFEDSRACMELMLWRVNRELLDPTWSWDD
ncbi:uncharacterized protein LOC6503884 isoform X2 [Drosophila ananassae]|uniref:uncharacterized protein LOC6503884 isoform X2 n=1 Tax=Drosophila ananassae TaxID=7217 RepID=UPI0013A5E157|nr:uncharacterized protein LOC6503884 isoform X2 [Drosophila ananassae]